MLSVFEYPKRIKHHAQAGVSLVEVLAAMFIMGLMTSLVVISIPRGSPPERQFAGALQNTIRESIDRAIIRGAPVAIDIRNNVIRVHDWKDSKWRAESSLEVTINGKIVAQQIEPYDPYRDEAKPELICDPTGLVSPAVFSITGRTERWDVIVTESGDVQLDER